MESLRICVFAVLSVLQAGTGEAVRTERGWDLCPVSARCTVDFDMSLFSWVTSLFHCPCPFNRTLWHQEL